MIAVLAVVGVLFWQFLGRMEIPQAPIGFFTEVYAQGLINPRVIAFDSQGRMLVSETEAGRVILVTPERRALLDDLDKPHGLAFYRNYLYVATVREVARYPYNAETATVDIAKKQNIASLPPGGFHATRTISFGKNFRVKPIVGGIDLPTLAPEKLYISVGSSCNVCLEDNWKYATILETDPTGAYTAELSGGLRNTVFFTFHPKTGELWATDTGRDGLGESLPPDEINIVKIDTKYGWPYCYGNRVQDKTFTEPTSRTDLSMDCSKTEPPIIELPAHSVPLGIVFVPERWPEPWRDRLLVAYKNKIAWFEVDERRHIRASGNFITMERPTDLKFGPDGALYVSDDYAGIIYKITPTP